MLHSRKEGRKDERKEGREGGREKEGEGKGEKGKEGNGRKKMHSQCLGLMNTRRKEHHTS